MRAARTGSGPVPGQGVRPAEERDHGSRCDGPAGGSRWGGERAARRPCRSRAGGRSRLRRCAARRERAVTPGAGRSPPAWPGLGPRRALLAGVSDNGAEGAGIADPRGPANGIRLLRDLPGARGVRRTGIPGVGIGGRAGRPGRTAIPDAPAALAEGSGKRDPVIFTSAAGARGSLTGTATGRTGSPRSFRHRRERRRVGQRAGRERRERRRDRRCRRGNPRGARRCLAGAHPGRPRDGEG